MPNPPIPYTQADVVAQVAADLTASGLSGASPVASGADNVTWLLTKTQTGPNGPEQVLLTVQIGPPDGAGTISCSAKLQTSQTVLFSLPPATQPPGLPGMQCTLPGARGLGRALVSFVNSLS